MPKLRPTAAFVVGLRSRSSSYAVIDGASHTGRGRCRPIAVAPLGNIMAFRAGMGAKVTLRRAGDVIPRRDSRRSAVRSLHAPTQLERGDVVYALRIAARAESESFLPVVIIDCEYATLVPDQWTAVGLASNGVDAPWGRPILALHSRWSFSGERTSTLRMCAPRAGRGRDI